MQSKIADLALQCDLLALNAMFETARRGTADSEYAQQAASLQTLSTRMQSLEQQEHYPLDTDGLLKRLQQRIALLTAGQQDIAALANTIAANARCATVALRSGDVESRVVVYSKHRAQELRAQQERIEHLQQELQLAVTNERARLESVTAAFAACRSEPGELTENSARPGR